MTSLADPGRDDAAETLRLYRAPETAMRAARADLARAKAAKAKDDWRRESERTTRVAKTAAAIGKRDGYRGGAYREAVADLAAQRGRSQDCERAWRRAERAAQAAERELRRARG